MFAGRGRFRNWLKSEGDRKDSFFFSFIRVLLNVRLLGAIGIIFYPISAPHTWRQVDTMSTALRYARRWTVETTDFAWWIPAVLNSRNTRGIMAMEFPAVDIYGALGFVTAGPHIDLGRRLAQLLLVILVSVLIVTAYQVWSHIKNAPRGMALAAMFAATCSFAIPFTAKFMPDMTAMLLALIGTAGIWQLRWWGVLGLGMAILIKPTTANVAAILLLHPEMMRVWWKQLPFVIFATLPAVAWYFFETPQLKQMQQIPSLFALFEEHKTLEWLKLFWTSGDIWDLISFHLVFQFGWVFLILALMAAKTELRTNMLKILGVLIVQASLIGALSGDHARLHAYYLIGLAPTVALFIYNAWLALPWRAARMLMLLGILVHSAEAMVADMSGAWNKSQGSAWFAECAELRRRMPDAPWNQGIPWRTPIEEYPLIDLCIGERGQSDVGKWGVFRVEQTIPSDCQAVAQTERLRLVSCAN